MFPQFCFGEALGKRLFFLAIMLAQQTASPLPAAVVRHRTPGYQAFPSGVLSTRRITPRAFDWVSDRQAQSIDTARRALFFDQRRGAADHAKIIVKL
jgi:hypothetical protein